MNDAYAHYIERMGKAPSPMLDDYSRRIENGQAYVLETDGTIACFVVLEDDSHAALLLDNIAVARSAQEQGVNPTVVSPDAK